MATKFKVKRSTVSGVTPTTGDIDTAELAINLPDRKLFTSNGTAVYELGSNLTNLSVSANLTIGASGDIVLTPGAGIYANGGIGSAGQVLASNGSSVYWAAANAGISAIVSEQFTANGTANSFTVSGGYIPSAIEVYLSGVKQVPVSDVIITSGSTVNFINTPLNGQVVDVFGYQSTGGISGYLALTGGTLGGNLTFANGSVIVSNGSFGTNGQVLTSNGTSMYWSSAGFTNGQSISVNNLVVTGPFTANGANGTAGQVLTTSGTGVYWSSAGVNTAAQYSWTNTHSFAANLTIGTTSELIISNGAGIEANGGFGTAGQVLTTSGTGVYWSSAGVNTAAQYTWTNTHNFTNVVTFSTSNAIILPVGNTASRPAASNGMIRYNTNTGLVEVVANSTWTGVMAAYSSVREQFTASNNQTTFTVTGGYVPNQIDVFYNGVKLRNGSEVTVSSGSTIVLATGASNNALVEVVGTGPSFVISNTAQIVYQQFTASNNQTTFTVTNGYVPGQVDVFADGIHLVNGVDVNVSSGSSVVLSTGVPNNTIVEVKGYSTPLVSAQTSTAVRQTFTANSTVNNNFTVTGGYIPGQVDVFYNGAKLVNGSDVNISSGSTVVLTSNAAANAIIDVVGINYYTAGGGVTTPVRQNFIATANQTTFTVTGGYTPGQIDVYRNGSKLSSNGDINISSGSTVVLASGAANGDVIDVVGFAAVSYQDSVRKSGDTMTGALTVSANLAITGAATFSNTIAVTGAATFSNTLAVTGTSTLTGNVTTSGVFTDGTTTIRPLVQGTANTVSGTSVDYTGIPSWVKRITIMFAGVSTNGTSIPQIQLGTSSGFEATGYLGSGIQLTDATSVNGATSTTGYQLRSALAANIIHGGIVIANITGNQWVAFGVLSDSSRGAGYLVSGSKSLAGVLTQIRLTTVNGTDTFDAGTVNILYE